MLLISALWIVLCSLGQVSSEYKIIKPETLTKAATVSQTQVKSGKIVISKKAVFSKLKKYLPQNILNNMPYFRQFTSYGSTTYFWSKNEPNSDSFIHKMGVTFDKNGIIGFSYKNYSFTLKKNKISKATAKKMVGNFAKDFINGGNKLSFVNKPTYDHLYYDHYYEKGVVESWVAEKNNKKYIVMVNLQYGFVEVFGIADKAK